MFCSSTRSLSAPLAALVALCALAARGDDVPAPPSLVTSGSLKELGEGFFELHYREVQPGKKKPKAATAYLQVDASTTWFGDTVGRVEDLAEGADLWVYGEPVESQSVNSNGQTMIDRQVRGVLAIATGVGLRLSAGDAERGPRWIPAKVSKAGQALHVTYSGQEYRVLPVRECAVVIRAKLEAAPEKLPKKLLAEVAAETSDARPEKAKAKQASFRAVALALLEPKLRAAYALFPTS